MMASAPVTDPAEAAPSSATARRKVVLAVLALHLAASLAFASLLDPDNDLAAAFLLGVVFGQISLLAMWTAWGATPLFLRQAIGLLAMGGFMLIMALFAARSSLSADATIAMYGAIFVPQWGLLQSVLWIARFARRRLAPRREFQFGVAQLLALTGCVAILLALARWLLSPGAADDLRDNWNVILAVAGLLAASNALAPLPAIGASLAKRPFAWLALAAIFVAGVTAAEHYVFITAFGPGPDGYFFPLVNATAFFVLTATLVGLRYAGHRRISAAPGTAS